MFSFYTKVFCKLSDHNVRLPVIVHIHLIGFSRKFKMPIVLVRHRIEIEK